MAILTVYTKLLDKSLTGARIIGMGSTRKAALDYYPTDNRYVIKAGSRIRAKAAKSIPVAIRKRRDELFAIPSIMHPEGDFYILQIDVELLVTSPSAAASFCTGTAMQGTTAWIDADKRSFASVIK